MKNPLDSLRLFNVGLVGKLAAMSDDELWNFLVENQNKISAMLEKGGLASGFLYAYSHGIDWLHKHFSDRVEDYREGVVFALVWDFCFEGEKTLINNEGMSRFLDHPDSCYIQTSEEILPPIDEDSEYAWRKDFFHLLKPYQAQHIIDGLEENLEELEPDIRGNIDKINLMISRCRKNPEYQIAYVFH
jgi:hypothetical protein